MPGLNDKFVSPAAGEVTRLRRANDTHSLSMPPQPASVITPPSRLVPPSTIDG